jgi:thioredoxin-related protein
MKYLILIIGLIFFMGANTNKQPAIFVDSLEDAVALSESIKKDIFVVFGAEWCGYCDKTKQDIKKNIDQLNDIIIVYVNIDDREDLKTEYRVKGIPDYMILRSKVETRRNVGYLKFPKLLDFIYK